MDLRMLATVFASIFMAELGDKTQLATLLYASQGETSRWTIFLGAASARVVTSAIGVLAGGLVSELVSPRVLNWVAGLGFVAIGLWILWRA
jgi:putative Ca2+/H+ antiporter (TMEM165/GDT1 family)